MFRKMSLVGLMIILSASAALCAFISPDSVLGGFTKCTTKYWNAKGFGAESYDPATGKMLISKTRNIRSEAQYINNGKIIGEVSIYEDKSLMQTILYAYNEAGNPLQMYVYKDDGTLYLKEITTNSKDTITIQTFTTLRNKDTVYKRIFAFDMSLKSRLEHSTMDDIGEDYSSKSISSLTYANDKHIYFTTFYKPNYTDITSTENASYSYKYDADGKIIETLRTDPDGEKTTTFNNYDGQGRLLETSVLKSDGSKKVESYYKYEDDGSKIEYENQIYGNFYLRYITRYDGIGRLFERVELHPSGKQMSIVSRKFDDENRIIEVTQNNPDDSKFVKRTFEYDKYGNLTKNIVYSPNNEPIKTVEYVYSK